MRATAFVCLLAQGLLASACLTEEELRGFRHNLPILHRRQRAQTNKTNDGTIPRGLGDRFKNGTVAPRGIGSQTGANFTSFYSMDQIQSATLGLVNEFNLTYFELPLKTFENRTMYGLKMPGKAGPTVLLQAGIHARERGGPDHLINFVADLLWAQREGTGLVYGGMSYTAQDVLTALSHGLVVLPLVNPDGVAFDHATNGCWRKNRNPASARPNDTDATTGVDLNRNFASVWDFRKEMAPISDDILSVSDDPESEVFHGTAPLSEPEARNIDWVMDQMPDLRWMADLHSHATQILYAWGHDTNQVRDPSMNLLNRSYDGKRGAVPDDLAKGYVYAEYIEQQRLDRITILSSRVADGMLGAAGRSYTAQISVGLYPTTGVVTDHVMYRSLVDSSKKTADAITIEFGQYNRDALCSFYPTVPMHNFNMMDVGAGLMEFLLEAARLG
ncbi:putative peptidase [Echria macrotheca]|uniref:Peptidase n=1 Tax=Echria macrotheca TaxID=438768 RepID=A0AAJ0BB20_9PEZI|nr:putative peptidase [Echria macrotheca]